MTPGLSHNWLLTNSLSTARDCLPASLQDFFRKLGDEVDGLRGV